MSYKEPLTIIEITQKKCSLEYGSKIYEVDDIGEAGGVVFYIDETVTPNIVYEAWTADETGTYEFKTTQTAGGGSGTAIGTGYTNTYTDVGDDADYPAFKVAIDATHGGYTDWFLPSKDELEALIVSGVYPSDHYWSSSEDNTTNAWLQNTDSGTHISEEKDKTFAVRLIRSFDADGCLASVGVTGADKCYNTEGTCQDLENFADDTLTLRFGTRNAKYDGVYIMPFIQNVSMSPAVINAGGASADLAPLGKRATASISMTDPPHSDFIVDPYLSDRSFDPKERSTFWRKWLARNPYYRYTEIKILTGYIGDAYNELESRLYLIDKIDLGEESVSITAKDPLVLVSNKRAQAPKATGGILDEDIDEEATTFKLVGVFENEYPTAGIIRIKREVMSYTGSSLDENELTLTGVTRGIEGTTKEEHKEDDRAQVCLKYSAQLPHDIVYDLMTTYSQVDTDYIDYDEWNAEALDHLTLYVLTGLITEPVGVDELIGELLESTLSYVYWNEKESQLKYKAYRPPTVTPPVITEREDVIAGSLSVSDYPDARLNQIWLFWGQKDPTEKLDNDNNWASIRIRVLGDDKYKDRPVRKIYSRWLADDAQALDITARMLARFQIPPKRITCQLLNNALFWTGQYITVDTKKIVDQYGQKLQALCEIISAQKERDLITYGMQSYSYVTPAEVPVPENMIILSVNDLFGYQKYDGTNGTINLINKYLKIWDAQGDEGGAETHEHDECTQNSGNAGTRGVQSAVSGSNHSAKQHQHQLTHQHDPWVNDPLNRSVIPYVGKGNLTSAMLMFYDSGVIPEGWEVLASYLNRYIKCAGSGSVNSGNSNHIESHTGNVASVTPASQLIFGPGNVRIMPQFNHTHSMNHLHTVVYDLIRINLLPVVITTGEIIPSGICAFFIGSVPPEGWSVYSEAKGRFIKASETVLETGGTIDHDHDGDMNTTTSGNHSSYGDVSSGATQVTQAPHNHSITHTHETQDWQPPFRELMFCKKD